MLINKKQFSKLHINEKDISALEGNLKVYHDEKSDGNYANPGEIITVSVAFPIELSVTEVSLVLLDAFLDKKSSDFKGAYKESDHSFDYFEFVIDKINSVGLFFYYFKIEESIELYGYRRDNNFIGFSLSKPEECSFFQLTVTMPSKKQNEKIQGIIYHIFVDRFFRSEIPKPKKDAVIIEEWNSEIPEYPKFPGAYLKNNTFFGGSLYGIIEKLEYIKSLGTSLIYLSPIFESPSNHKYDTSDYEKIDSMFGGEKALKMLINEAKKLNIGIILDGVFNHTGADSKYFNKYGNYNTLGAFQSKNSPYYDWYRFKSFPNEYESWWGIDILPRIFYGVNGAENYFLGKGGVVEKWMKVGINGFRLDVVDELSDAFVEKMRSIMSEYTENPILYGEVWEDASNKIAYGKRKKYYLGSELSGVMNYPLRKGIISYIKEKNEAELRYAISTVMMNMPKSIRDMAMNILGSHDTERIITVMSGNDYTKKTNNDLAGLKLSNEEYAKGKKRLIAAYTVLALIPGIPTVYYGDEVGLEGFSDPFNRRTYPWGFEDQDILSHYRIIGKLRCEHDVLFDGDFFLLHLDRDLLIFERKKENERIILVYNNSCADINLNFSDSVTDLFNTCTAKEFVIRPETAYAFKSNSICKIKIGC